MTNPPNNPGHSDALPRIPARPAAGHKGTFGTVAVVGGCAGAVRMIGAPALAARGAARAGAGLVRLVAPLPVLDAAISLAPWCTGVSLPTDAAGRLVAHDVAAIIDDLASLAQCIIVGVGLGAPEDDKGVCDVTLRVAGQDECPVVIDADGLNALALTPQFVRDCRARMVLTPHPGEFRRLAAALAIDEDPVDPASRPHAAAELARRVGCIVALKGMNTVVSDGQRTWVCRRGHPCMATGGTGDVLSGVIGGFVAQFASTPAPALIPEAARARLLALRAQIDLYDAVRLAVEAHAVAGELWAARNAVSAGLIATELADLVPAAIESLRGVPTRPASAE